MESILFCFGVIINVSTKTDERGCYLETLFIGAGK